MKTVEQRLNEYFEKIKSRAVEYVNSAEVDDDHLMEYIGTLISALPESKYMTISDISAIKDKVFNSIRGLGMLDDIMNDENITEIMINGPDNVFVEISRSRDLTLNGRQLPEMLSSTIIGQSAAKITILSLRLLMPA